MNFKYLTHNMKVVFLASNTEKSFYVPVFKTEDIKKIFKYILRLKEIRPTKENFTKRLWKLQK